MIASLLLGIAVADTPVVRLATPPWTEIRADAHVEVFDERLGPWHYHTVGISRREPRGSAGVGATLVRRFGRTDGGGEINAALRLWSRAYGAARVYVAPGAEVSARSDLSLDLYQGLRHGFEASGGIRRLEFANVVAPIGMLGVAKYVGPWYARGSVAIASPRGRTATAWIGEGRRYFHDNSTEYVTLLASTGREIEVLDAVLAPRVRRVSTLSARAQWLATRTVGVHVGAAVSEDELLPTRVGLTLGSFARW